MGTFTRLLPSRYYSSALYIPKNKANKHYVILVPVIELEKHFLNKSDLAKNISLRHLDIDVDSLEKHYRFYQFMEQRKRLLEMTRVEIGLKIKDLMGQAEINKDGIEMLKQHSKMVKNILGNVKDHYYGVEEDTMLKFLNLPNILHERTPHDNEEILFEHLTKPSKITQSHMQIARDKNIIKYYNPFTCYLKGEAALFELSLLNYFRNALVNSEYTQFFNSNFCRSIIVEGCGEEPKKTLTIEDVNDNENINRLHLCGSSTLLAFMAYFARHQVQSTLFPLKYFSVGKQYFTIDKSAEQSLLNLNQQSCANFFIADINENNNKIDLIVEEIKKYYSPLGYHFRVVLTPANQLKKSETLKIAVQMYSGYLDSYIEVGNVSFYEDFISKRLLFTCQDKNKKYPHVISGVLVNVPKVLACTLENDYDLLTDLLKKHLFN